MNDQDIKKEQGLRDIYYNPATGYQSAERLYRNALEEGLNVSRNEVKEWLKTQDTYTRYKPIVRKHDFRRTYVYYLGEQVPFLPQCMVIKKSSKLFISFMTETAL